MSPRCSLLSRVRFSELSLGCEPPEGCINFSPDSCNSLQACLLTICNDDVLSNVSESVLIGSANNYKGVTTITL